MEMLLAFSINSITRQAILHVGIDDRDPVSKTILPHIKIMSSSVT